MANEAHADIFVTKKDNRQGTLYGISCIVVNSFDYDSSTGQGFFDSVARLNNEEYEVSDLDDVLVKIFAKKGGKSCSGYMKKSDFTALNVQTVPIPANFAGLEAEVVPTRLQDQLFRIVEVEESDDCVTVTARHVWYDNLENYTLWKPTETGNYSAAAVCRNILSNAISPVSSHVASDCTDTKVGKDLDFERKNIVEAFLDPEKGVCETFGLSLIRNNWDFYCLKEVGYDRGTVIQNGKNLLGVDRTESIENLVTRCCPVGKNAKGDIVWMNHNGKKYLDSNYVNDYSYPRVEIYDTGLQIGKDGVTEQNINDKLLQAAQKRFAEDKVDLPEVEMTIEFLSLGDTEEYAQYRDLDKVYLYDILTIKDTVRGYNYSAQVIGVEHDILTGMLNSVTIGTLSQAGNTRKIARWQVPEVDGTNIRLKSIMAGSFESGAIQSDDLASGIITYAHIAEATIDALTSDSITAVTAQIHEIIAGSLTAEDIQAGSITTITLAANAVTSDKIEAGAVTAGKIAADAVTAENILAGAVTTVALAANAVTANKIDAGAVTADKLAADAVTADKISATDLSAINAKLGTADIADARIASADISFAKIKDLNASSAYFGQAVFDEAIGGKLYVPRLMVGYAQMVSATIGDLVIKATDDNYYHLDVNATTGAVTATQVYPSSQEIEDGHTSTGQTIIDTDIVAENLSTANIYATHALMDEINANIINVDNLFAREATISKINALDLSSNTYIASTIGNWQSGSTITQTINSLDSRIASLGYGTIFYSETEPSHSGLVEGDIWIKPLTDNTWSDIDDLTWQYLQDSLTWEEVFGAYKMYAWTGTEWKLLYDTTVNASMSTQIAQNTYAITLKADQSDLDILSGEITEFSAELEIQSEQIQAAVSTVNAKVASYLSWADPTLTEDVTIGDIWMKTQSSFGSWAETKNSTWQTLYSTYVWKDALGYETYVWDGTQWVLSSDHATEVYYGTLITENARSITLEAEARAKLGDDLVQTKAELKVTNSSILAEVQRATTAEGGKIDKTSQYQTADSIVTEAVRQSGVNADANYISKTSTYQDADSIVSEAVRQSAVSAGSSFIAKTTQLQTADAIVSEAVSQAMTSAGSSFIAKTSQYQSASAIVSEAVRQSTSAMSGSFISKTNLYQTADAIVAAAETYTDDHSYSKISQITITSNGVDVKGSKHINLDVNTNNYVHINSNGIDMKGKRVTVDGNSMWARDDIIVMNPNDTTTWRRSVAAIEAHMSGKHDWVLIKPYYNSEINYVGHVGLATYDTVTNSQYEQTEAYRAFGDGSEWYQYEVELILKNYYSQIRQPSNGVYVFLANQPFTFSGSTNRIAEATAQADIVLHEENVIIPANGNTKTLNFTHRSTTGLNLCGEGKTVYYYINGVAYDQMYVTEITLRATTDATTSRVPCTTYYYP